KISVLVDKADGPRALRAVHQAFRLQEARPGAGLPGGGGVTDFRPRPAPIIDGAQGRDLAQHVQHLASMEEIVVSDVLLKTDEGQITVFELPDRAGNCSQIFQAIAAAGIVVDMIVQNLTDNGCAQLSFSVPRNDLGRAHEVTNQVTRAIDLAIRAVADA